ncbi:hypothetical protein Y032_0075g963 [Ancylostoma ceylanicum]|uniref:Uncharacterized protein n=1 Tax=Ancylostoma ceylanicum TaxID=53326 RepID=A0A016TUW4_9BILA|nr:hypothetical protein Y032_0075g963 [Ancylostoma ceylanicum]
MTTFLAAYLWVRGVVWSTLRLSSKILLWALAALWRLLKWIQLWFLMKKLNFKRFYLCLTYLLTGCVVLSALRSLRILLWVLAAL